jgi:predicted RNA-binding Zn ribbon-like protein
VEFASHLNDLVRVSSALVNAATPGERQGRPYPLPPPADLAAQLHAALLQADRNAPAPGDDLPHYVELAEGLRPLFEAADRADWDTAAAHANRLLARYRPTPHLEKHGDRPWHLHFHGPADADPIEWAGAFATALAAVVGSDYASRLGVCAAPACDRVFVDVSRNGNRRFCSEACQNRVKAAAHRARQRA